MVQVETRPGERDELVAVARCEGAQCHPRVVLSPARQELLDPRRRPRGPLRDITLNHEGTVPLRPGAQDVGDVVSAPWRRFTRRAAIPDGRG
ncbi:hypothetical protein Sme01_67070 [Sphaerisporangium melleum]|uniref:Uncharacterized protein n=1 Tax=Sphaerisporangium melleum TaxID=321316 RepID=A0A917RGC4_9ACTN|nr:hypothetical protein GCM10007964_56300 [Sphaerisporangium melleum]GII74231.1 hypothetical protein Sme01_67070 [Sphaerisporangium melleum]